MQAGRHDGDDVGRVAGEDDARIVERIEERARLMRDRDVVGSGREAAC